MEATMRKLLSTALVLTAFLAIAPHSLGGAEHKDTGPIAAVLDELHMQAARADGEAYFALFAEGAVFIGTDASERWPLPVFRDYAMARFATGTGWTYVPKERHIDIAPAGDVAWFDEILWNEKYGTSRGTGVLVLEGGQWKIAQYHLTFPVPNDLAADVTAQIKDYEARTREQP